MRKATIIEELNREFAKLADWYSKRDAVVLEKGPDGAWTAGQHLLHLVKSTVPLATHWQFRRWRYGSVSVRILATAEIMHHWWLITNGALMKAVLQLVHMYRVR